MSAGGEIPVWSWFVRLCHWGVAGAVLFDLFNDTGPIHRLTGYVAASLVLIRLAHGALARPGSYAALPVPGWRAIRAHLDEMLAHRVTRSIGHNPIGQWMAYVLWTLVLALGVTGWMTRLDEYWGEEWLIELHENLAHGLLVCVAVHLLGVAVMSRLQGENLVRAMLTGRKRA